MSSVEPMFTNTYVDIKVFKNIIFIGIQVENPTHINKHNVDIVAVNFVTMNNLLIVPRI